MKYKVYKVRWHFYDKVKRMVGWQVWNQVSVQVGDHVFDHVGHVFNQVDNQVDDMFRGQFFLKIKNEKN